MFFKSIARPLTIAASALIIAGFSPILAQEPKPEAPSGSSPAVKKAYDPTRRVPDYFGQIGLSPEQKELIYKIKSKHNEKIEALQKQIASIQVEMLAECERELNETQKKLLEFRRANAVKGKKASPGQAEAEPGKGVAKKDSDQ